jgi:asparagine synthase (glutamine-hydrolysing)
LLARFAPDWVKSLSRRLHAPRVWPDWLPDAFAARTGLGPRMRALSARAPRVNDDVLQDSLLTLTLGGPLLARESSYRAAADAGIDVRHPMLDREFIEFVISLPDDLRMRGRESRFILRRAMSPLLPPVIRDRSTKGDATVLVGLATAELLAGRTSIDGRASARGWIDPARLWPRLSSLALGNALERVPAEGDDLLWAAVAVEEWLADRGA